MNKFNIIDWVKRIFGVDPITSYDQQARTETSSVEYLNAAKVNLTAIFANKLSTLTLAESDAEVIGENQRAVLLSEAIQSVWLKARKWAGLTFGTGGVLLVPYTASGKIYTDIVPQDRMIINRINGDELRAVTILADTTRQKDKLYYRWTNYDLDDSGMLTITNRVTNDSGASYSLTDLAEWAAIPEEMQVSGCEHLPLAYLKCPVDNRRGESLYGVPVTFGCDSLIGEITECLNEIRKEYNLKSPIIFMDQLAFKNQNGKWSRPLTGLVMTTNPGALQDAGKFSEVYDPAIRDSAYYNRLIHLYELLEKQVGTSRGILTEPQSRGATATEIKAGLYDTYAIISDMRKVIEHGFDRLLYAMNVLANMYNLAPMGDYELSFDWSYSMIESSQESFTQLVTAAQAGAIEPAELRQFVMPDETLEEAQERCDEIAAKKKDSSRLLMEEALNEEAQLG